MSSALSPTTALRAIRRVTADKAITPAQRLVIIAVILRADNRTALAWTSFRSLRAEHGFANDTIKAAFGGPSQRYLELAGIGARGARQYKVRPFQSVEHCEAPDGTSSVPATGTDRSSEWNATVPDSGTKLALLTSPCSDPKGASPEKAKEETTNPDPMAAWCEGYRARFRADVPNRGKVAGLLARLGKSRGKAALCAMVRRWWGSDRSDFGIELFEARVNGDNAELVGRDVERRESKPHKDAQTDGTDAIAKAIAEESAA